MPTRGARARPGTGRYAAVRRYGVAHVIVAVTVISVGALGLTYNFIRDRDAHIATAKTWDIQGPPCPSITAAEWTAKRYKAEKTFDYDGIAIGRLAGHAHCSDVHDHGGAGFGVSKVCQFTSPAVLTVTSRAGTFYFVPGIGQLASLIIEKDVPRCVMASHYTLQSPD